ncbi:MAG: tetraacyldisaccharide 4'-kinase [Deltaproteobacteria bacterium]|nr:tetraacyldisaccharide 4'-kinase [Deltaproteobacteria bacterium]
MIDWAGIHVDKGFRMLYLPLSLLSLIYGAGVAIRLKRARSGEKKALPGFTVSIGNLTAGGTGKTPATCMMAEWAKGEGYNVAVLSRGYGSKNREKLTIVSDGENVLAGPEQAGDEPYLMACRLPGVPVIIAKDRCLAGLTAIDRFKSSFFILDDGYQHLALKRDLDLLLLDAASPFGNGRLLPRGPLREPVSEAARADAVILTRAGSLTGGKGSDNDLGGLLNIKPLFMCEHLPDKVIFPAGKMKFDPSFLKGKRVMAFAGIARPDSFRDTLVSLGADIVSFRSFPDHYPFSGHEIKGLREERDKSGADFLITTEKDWVRASDMLSADVSALYLTVRFDFLSNKEGFFRMVNERIKSKKGEIS